ncbi:glycoside hydrolase family 28 protein [Sphingobacterium alkalisoli]|uniref:Glycoside hydrolase family 28 protein n=1 Tax=Sphingobacterium alkalisoli TaxID=1874115 RepID=A0A4V5LXR6_9SPHI|nr:glycoside hydrolase family 28 protein [Sphingobacterium alkalisoli]TJY63629.1 glycoside hydrolase family 28 protein [Sphingobacterium alkalisoli]GGH27257.1 glycoside hydrolase [Sphingobacterium alkalisoli]
MIFFNFKKTVLTGIATLVILCLSDDLYAQSVTPQAASSFSWTNLPQVAQPQFKKDTIDIRTFGASPDGYTLNTKNINDAISVCNGRGGGVVLIPAGYWLSGPIELKSNVNLHLADNAFVQFTADFNQYEIIEGNYEGKPSARNQSPISGRDLENIAITGKGTIDGNGDAWRMVGRNALTEGEWREKIASGGLVSDDGKTWFPSEKTKLAHEEKRSVLLADGGKLSDFEGIKDYLRPNLVVLTNCKKVLLEGITFQNSPAWNLHPLMCQDLTLRNVLVKNPDYAQNGDGVDIESCARVLIENCVFDVGDDAICIKSGKDEEGRKRNIPTEQVIIRRSKVYLGHGGFVVGSEMSGGARDIFVEDCTFMGTDKGIRFKTTRGRGGIVENIHIRNINMSNIVQEAIFFDMYYWTKPPQANEVQVIPEVTVETPQIRNVFIDRVTCNGAAIGVFMRGLPEMPIQNIRMSNLFLTADRGVEIKDAQHISINDATFHTDKSNRLIYVENAKDLFFDQLDYNPDVSQVLEVNGAESNNLRFKNAKFDIKQIKLDHGARSSAVQID